MTGTSCYCFEYNLHLIKIPSHLNRESIYREHLCEYRVQFTDIHKFYAEHILHMAHTHAHAHPRPQSSKDHSVPLDSTAIELSTDTDSNSTPVDPLCSETNVTSRYCRVCHHSQPMRSKHCYQCGRCVRKFDHHCPWLGNCVGERNHRFFWMFLTCETALLIWGVCITW